VWLVILENQERSMEKVACVFLPLLRQEQRGSSTADPKYTQDGSKKRAMVHIQRPPMQKEQAKGKSGYRKGMGRKRVDLKAQLLQHSSSF
jgi:hypothetical protein